MDPTVMVTLLKLPGVRPDPSHLKQGVIQSDFAGNVPKLCTRSSGIFI